MFDLTDAKTLEAVQLLMTLEKTKTDQYGAWLTEQGLDAEKADKLQALAALPVTEVAAMAMEASKLANA